MADVKFDFIEYKNIFKDKEKRLQLISKLSFIPTPIYLKLIYFIKTGKRLSLKHPKGFSQKINWLKINAIDDSYSILVDKYAVKEYISSNFGKEYVVPCLGVWNRFEDINFDELPNSFVLKCTHDSGSVQIIKDKSKIDYQALKDFYSRRLKINPYLLSREYPYKNVKPRIIAEEFFENLESGIVYDYKFFCFQGEPKVLYVLSGRMKDEKETWFDMQFNRLDIIDVTTPDYDETIVKPDCFDKMLDFVYKLAQGKKFVRIDLYENQGKIYFGEFTFFPYGGCVILQPETWEKQLGDWIQID